MSESDIYHDCFSMTRQLIIKFIKFCGVGAIATLCHWIAAFILFKVSAVPASWASAIGATIGAVFSYFLNRSLTFSNESAYKETVWKFAFVACGAAGFTWLLMHYLADVFINLSGSEHFGFLIAQAITTILVLLWTFPVNLLWTFADNKVKEKKHDGEKRP